MSTFSSHRIGSRASEDNGYASTSESSVLRSLFELRKTYTHQSGDDVIQHLAFWNCEWSPRIIQSLRKILVRDGRRFASIKFFDCAIQSDKDNSQSFEQILQMVLVNNSTASLVIKGGKLIGNSNVQEPPQSSCPLSCPSTSVTNALREELPANTSLASLNLSGLDFSSPSTVESLSNALSRNVTLQSVSLRQSSLDDESISKILQSVMEHPNLNSIDLSKNYLGARKNNTASSSTMALDSVSELLRSKTSKLEHLNLSNQYQQHPIRTTYTQPLTHIAQEQIQEHMTAFGKALIALSTNQGLKSIDLSRNPGCLSDPTSVEALSVCLSNNTCLEHVNISDCGMAPEGIAYLARKCLPFCGASLKSLVVFGSHLEESAFTCASAAALEKGLLSNMTLENLGELPCESENETIGITCKRIQHTLNLNKGGRRAFRSSLAHSAWSNILARAGNSEYDQPTGKETPASVVFSLLRQGPILMEQ